MKAVDIARSLLIVPSSSTKYEDIRPHHLVLGFALIRIVTTSMLYRKITDKIMNILSDMTESCIPLIHHGLVPDCIIRWGIRLQLR